MRRQRTAWTTPPRSSARMVVVTPPASLAGIAWIRTVRPSADGCAGMTAAMPGPSAKALGTTVDRLRTELPPAVQIGGAAAEDHDLEKALAAVTPLVLGIVLGLGFLLLLVALQAPLAAAPGVVTNLLAVGAAFGVGRLIFQDGHGAGFLGFTSQGYVDAWAPKERGVVLGVAVLRDALLLRLLLLLLPVLLRLAGRAGWASPAWLTRILPTVRFSPV